MKKIILLLLCLSAISCNKKPKENLKKYTIDFRIKINDFEGKHFSHKIDTINAVNDSLASIDAFTSFYISQETFKKYEAKKISMNEYISFTLRDSNQNDIYTDKYITDDIKKKILKDIERIVNTDYTSTNDAESKINAKPISEDFIKKDLYNPSTADFSLIDATQQVDGNIYRILRKVAAKNSLGIEREYIYEVKIEYLGGNEYDTSSWKLVSIRSEEYK
jgi:hypothetical protein